MRLQWYKDSCYSVTIVQVGEAGGLRPGTGKGKDVMGKNNWCGPS